MSVKLVGILCLLILPFTAGLGQSRGAVRAALEPLALRLELPVGVELSKTNRSVKLLFDGSYCTVEPLDAPRGEITAYDTALELGNGLNIRYDLSKEDQTLLEGLLFSNTMLYKISGYSEAEPDGHFCLDIYARLEPLEGEMFK